MPMFPLGSVLFPGAVLPLHVFEPRYRQLVRDCLENPAHEFGVVLIERGFEVGGGDVRSMSGTIAKMLQVAEMPDGRYALVTVGTRRVRIREWMDDDPYPRALVEDWPDDEGDTDENAARALADLVTATAARVRRVNALAAEVGEQAADATSEISGDPLLASYHLASLAPIGSLDRQRLLCARGPRERLHLLDVALDDVEAVLAFRLTHPGDGDESPFDLEGP